MGPGLGAPRAKERKELVAAHTRQLREAEAWANAKLAAAQQELELAITSADEEAAASRAAFAAEKQSLLNRLAEAEDRAAKAKAAAIAAIEDL